MNRFQFAATALACIGLSACSGTNSVAVQVAGDASSDASTDAKVSDARAPSDGSASGSDGAAVDAASCTEAQTSCHGACVDTSSAHDNCGTCGHVCGAAEACVSGVCATSCPSGEMVCAGACVTASTDNANCGTCGTTCGAGQVCSNGTCGTTCAANLTTCGADAGPDAGAAYCADTTSESTNCGGCGHVCPSGQTCQSGACAALCNAGQSVCGVDAGAPFCTDLTNDRLNCGTCGTTCGAGDICSNGLCATTCAANLTTCGLDAGADAAAPYCANTATDNNNCGGCGVTCGDGQSCQSGLCVTTCGAGLNVCASETDGGASYCANFQTDNANCGACGAVCPAGESCSAAKCEHTCSVVADCSPGAVSCTSNLCVFAGSCLELEAAGTTTSGAYYIDADGTAGPLPPFPVYCDMSDYGGGWTKVLQYATSAYTPTTSAAGDITTSTPAAFAKLSDAEINAIGGSTNLKYYRMGGTSVSGVSSYTPQELFLRTANTYVDTARAAGLMSSGRIDAVVLTDTPTIYTTVTGSTIDTLQWGITPSNDCTRIFTDYSGAGQCYNPSSTTQRCYDPGVACNNHQRLDGFTLWTRESYDAVIKADSPLAYFPLNDAASPAVDVIGSRQAAQTGGPTFHNATAILPADYSVAFNGSQKLDVPYDATLNPSGDFTIEAWFEVTGGAGNYRSVVTSRDDYPQRGYILYVNPSGQMEFWIGNGTNWTTATTTAILPLNTRLHAVGTYSGTTLTLYVNGVQVGTATGTIDLNTSKPFRIGMGATEGSGTYGFTGPIAGVAFYGSALSASQIALHYAAGQ